MTDQATARAASDIDWPAFAADLAPVPVIDETVLVRKRSRDFFWYSPILNAALKKSFGDLVAQPRDKAEMAHVLEVAARHRAPASFARRLERRFVSSLPVDATYPSIPLTPSISRSSRSVASA